MFTAALTFTIAIGIIVMVAAIGKTIQVVRHYFWMKKEIENYKRFEKQVQVLLDALERRFPQQKVVEIKDYMRDCKEQYAA